MVVCLRMRHARVEQMRFNIRIQRRLCEGRSLPSEKLQNESSPNFSNLCPKFCPGFCSEFSPNFSRIVRALFRGKRRSEKIHQKSPAFFNAKFPGKLEEKSTKVFWRAGKVTNCKTQKSYSCGCCSLHVLFGSDPPDSNR